MTTPPQTPSCRPAAAARRRIPGLVLAALGALGLAALAPAPAAAAEPKYPDKPMRIVVPYPPGGFNDTLGRLLARKLQEAWGQPVVVENRPGAGTIVGTQAVATAPADGHTLLVVQFPFAANPWLYRSLPYDTQKAFAPVWFAGRAPMLLVTNAASPWKTQKELLAQAAAKPNGMNYGSSGAGSSNHLAMALFESVAKVQLNQVPYKGSTPMLTDLAGGQLDAAFDALPHALPFIQSGRMRALAVASAQRTPLMPDLPTTAEAGLPGYEVSSWHGVVVPAGTPAPVVARLNGQFNAFLAQDEVRKVFAQQGVQPEGGTPAQFAAFIDGQMSLWKRVIQQRGITVD